MDEKQKQLQGEKEKKQVKRNKKLLIIPIFPAVITAGCTLLNPEKGENLVGGFLVALFGMYFFTLVVFTLIYRFFSNSKAKGEQIEKETQQREAFMRNSGFLEMVEMQMLSGLPIAEGSMCTVCIGQSGFQFMREGNVINLPLEKISDVMLRTDEEVKKHYVAYYMSHEEIVERQVKFFLIITYRDAEQVKQLLFKATNSPQEQRIVSIWKSLPKAVNVVDL